MWRIERVLVLTNENSTSVLIQQCFSKISMDFGLKPPKEMGIAKEKVVTIKKEKMARMVKEKEEIRKRVVVRGLDHNPLTTKNSRKNRRKK